MVLAPWDVWLMLGVIVAILLLYPPDRAHAVKPPAVRNRRGQMRLAD